ncbi:DUF6364 family protein [Kibdelosporangium philippinense]|uniref:DUF6364 family protein n=1 Tax=Kibdelosporangium philippinense TaxID=211113 RepID=A0ABS8ZL13_9PSEU|nr:DUF6364 family protein [Kibdelosporangium philippinense]MCE7008490.1 DUF6364 family protein [Kibdelosporangium philippinense]
MKRNITVQLDEEIIDRAKVLAAKRGTSVSALLSHQVIKMTEEAARYEAAKQRALARMDNAIDRGGATWTREELHDRAQYRKDGTS